MHLSRRMRLIWHKLWLIPLVGATTDVVAGEVAKIGGVTATIPWQFSAIGVAGMLVGAVVRTYLVPLIPEGLEAPDEQLTRRSRILGGRLGATPVRVFVADLPRLNGKVETFIDGHDLFVSKRVAKLPGPERDFILARALVGRGPAGRLTVWVLTWAGGYTVVALVVTAVLTRDPHTFIESAYSFLLLASAGPLGLIARNVLAKRLGFNADEPWNIIALRATGKIDAATNALKLLADTYWQKRDAATESDRLKSWWKISGQKAFEASEWYHGERSLATKAE